MKKLNVEGSLKKDKFEAEAPIQVDKVQLTMNLVIRLTFPHPMKLKREIKGHEVIVLIHCRATHNFIMEIFVAKLGIVITKTMEWQYE